MFYTYVTGLSGKKKKYTSPAFRTKSEALKAEAAYCLKYRGEAFDCGITFKDLYEAYYIFQKDKVKDTTLKTYRDRIKYMSYLDNIKIKDLDSIHYFQWRDEINKLPISTAYKNQIQKFIKIVINWGAKTYDLDFRKFYSKITPFTNPFELKEEMDFYTLDEFKQFISFEKDILYKCLYETLYFCGLRRGEARALTWNDVNFINKTIRINKNCVTIGGESSNFYKITTPKTNSSNRIIPMPDQLVDDLKKLFNKNQKEENFSKLWFVFGGCDPIKNSNIRYRKNKIAKEAGLREIRLHDFRHSCASLLINNGANITLVAKFLGHTKIDETLNTYSHMYGSKLDELVKTINKIY